MLVLATRWCSRASDHGYFFHCEFSLVADSEAVFNKGRLKWMTLFIEMRVIIDVGGFSLYPGLG